MGVYMCTETGGGGLYCTVGNNAMYNSRGLWDW